MGWTDEQVEELKRLWEKGLTTGEIGKALGVSKNAVVGKAHRLGLNGRPSPIRRGDEETEETVSEPVEKKKETKVAPPKKKRGEGKTKTVHRQ